MACWTCMFINLIKIRKKKCETVFCDIVNSCENSPQYCEIIFDHITQPYWTDISPYTDHYTHAIGRIWKLYTNHRINK